MDYTFNTKTVINEDFILKKDDTLTVMGESELIIGETVHVTFNANGTIIILGKLVLLNCDFNWASSACDINPSSVMTTPRSYCFCAVAHRESLTFSASSE